MQAKETEYLQSLEALKKQLEERFNGLTGTIEIKQNKVEQRIIDVHRKMIEFVNSSIKENRRLSNDKAVLHQTTIEQTGQLSVLSTIIGEYVRFFRVARIGQTEVIGEERYIRRRSLTW